MRFKLLPNVTPVTSGQPAQVRLPVPGPTFDRILLRMGATASPGLAAITNIRVVADGNVIQEYADATVLDSINQYHGRDAIGGAGTVASPYDVCIYFRRPEVASFLQLSEVAAERVTALRTRDIKSAWVEFTITGAGAFCTAFSDEEPVSEAEASGLITRVKKYTYNGVAGDQETLFDIARGDGKAGIIAVHYKKADVTKITLKENGFSVLDSATKEALQDMQDGDGRVPVAGYTVVDFCSNGNLNEVLLISPQRDFRATATITAGAAYDVYVEYLDRIGSGM